MNILRSKLWISKFVLISFLFINCQQFVYAGMVGTSELLDDQLLLNEKQNVISMLERDDVRAKLESLGVDSENAKLRVESMSPEEIHQLAANIEELPAGSGALGIIAFVFLVLLLTDLLGYTDVFPFVKKTVN